jgi:dolichol-phosphate mannosyltransferase
VVQETLSAPQLSVVLPTLNEAPNVARLLPALAAQAAALGLTSEFIVVDGPSTDGTREAAAKAGARALAQRGRGYGEALTEGLAASRGDWVLTLDADGSHPPEDLPRFWAAREGHDLLVGSRYCAGGRADMPLQRQLLSRSLNLVSRLRFGWSVRDSSSGFRLYRGSTARAAAGEAPARDFTIQQQLLRLIIDGGGRVAELPFHYRPREAGVSKASALRLAPAYLRLLLSRGKG